MMVRKVCVIGAGTMGHGIAQVAAMSAYDTVLYDIDEGRLTTARKTIEANLAKGVEKGKVSPVAMASALTRLTTETNMKAAAQDADLVIEAAPEKLELKRELFGSLAKICRPDCLLATNTSSLSVGEIAKTIDRPERFLGMHFFNPAHIMELLEIVRAPDTSDAAIAEALRIAERMGKQPIVVRDSPGFASSRLGVVLGLEAMRMLEQGVASAHDIDRAMELGYRHPMGPLRLTDLVGLDVRLGIAEYLHRELKSDAFAPPKLLRDMVAQGKLGKKSGQGFYSWNDGKG